MIPDQTVSIKVGRYKNKYIKLGYPEAEFCEYIDVNINDISPYANIKVKFVCDYCGEIFYRMLSDYNKRKKKSFIKKDCCLKCFYLKQAETIKQKYDVDYIAQIESGKEKRKVTNLKKYGYTSPLKSKSVQDKLKQTCLKKYGVENVLQVDSIKQKVVETNLKKYGVKYTTQAEEVKQKMRNTLLSNGQVPTSTQQIYIFNLLKELGYDVYLNYQLNSFNLDVALFIDDLKIDIEYDGWYWHQDVHKDVVRNHVIVKYGWNVIRILSGQKVPTKIELINTINSVISENKKIQLIILDDWKLNNYKKKEV